MSKFYLGDLTQVILDEYFGAFYKLDGRAGLTEAELANALAVALKQHSLHVQQEVFVQHSYMGQKIGTGFIDLLVNSVVVIETKNLVKLRRGDVGQLRGYLQAGNYPVGLLLNFGGHKPELQRIENRNAFPPEWRG